VLQVGLTDRDQYIHRLGRTARAGMQGRGVLVLADFEKPLLRELGDLPMTEAVPSALSGPSRTIHAMENLSRDKELEKSAQQSYQAWLGFYNSNMKRLRLDRVALVEMAAQYSANIGLHVVPKLEKKILKKMGLFGVPGIEPSPHAPRSNNGGGGRGGGASGRGGDGHDDGGRGSDRRGGDRRGGSSSGAGGRGRGGHNFGRR
jgi:ATP-dependent RNA helicase MSS116